MGKIVGLIVAHPNVRPAASESEPDKQKEMFACTVCGKEYKTERGLADHMAREHPLDILQEDEPDTEQENDPPV